MIRRTSLNALVRHPHAAAQRLAPAAGCCASDDYGSPLHPAFMTEIFNF